MSEIKLNPENSLELLKQYLDVGYKQSGLFSIKDGANIHRCYRVLKGNETDDDLTPSKIYNTFFRFIELANKNKAYSLDDSAIIDAIITYINNSVLNPVKDEEKVEAELITDGARVL